jgi:hypothetical protein
VLARPEHAYPSRIISLLIPFFIVFHRSVGQAGCHLIEREMRTIAVEEEDLRGEVSMFACVCSRPFSISVSHIELINESVDAGFVASQVFGSSHGA